VSVSVCSAWWRVTMIVADDRDPQGGTRGADVVSEPSRTLSSLKGRAGDVDRTLADCGGSLPCPRIVLIGGERKDLRP